MREIAEAILRVLDARQRAALATVVRTGGSAPQRVGARLLLLSDGTRIGTVGGGAIEQLVLQQLEEILNGGEARIVKRDLTRDLAMCCGGSMEVLVEPIERVPTAVLCGAGHIAAATAPLVKSLGFAVHVVDEREELNTEERFAGCTRHLLDPIEYLKRNPLTDDSWVLIATHDHHLDGELLELTTQQPHAYIGMVGSKRKVLRLVERAEARYGSIPLERTYAPVGLDLGAAGPQEIAVSIAAEWIALRRGKDANHLRSLKVPAASLEGAPATSARTAPPCSSSDIPAT